MQQPLVSFTTIIVLFYSLMCSNRVGIACEMRNAYVLSYEICTLVVVLAKHVIK